MRLICVLMCIFVSLALTTGVSLAKAWQYSFMDSGCDEIDGSSIVIGNNEQYPYFIEENTIKDLKYAYWTGSEWNIQTVDSEGSVGKWTSIALDSQDFPHISYYEYIDYYTGALKYAQWTGSEWYIQVVDFDGNVGRYSSIALDTQDCAHISYYDDNDNNLKYCKWTGSEWEIQTVDSYDTTGKYTSIALDSQDNPHISYCFGGYYTNLKYAYWTGSVWEIYTVDGSPHAGLHSSVSVDSQDYPHISYSNQYVVNSLWYAKWNGNFFEKQVVDTGEAGRFNSIAIDSQNQPHISYKGGSGNLEYAHCTGSGWDKQIVDDGFAFSGTSIAIDSQDYPHVSYYAAKNEDLKYSYWTGEDWEIQVVDSELEVGKYSSIALDDHNYPHISYFYLGCQLGTDVELISFNAQAKGNTISITWHVQTTEGEQIAGFNLYRREMIDEMTSLGEDRYPRLLEDNWQKINPDLITGENPYSYTDSHVDFGVAYQYKLEAVLAADAPEILGTTQATAGQPISFSILALYPNPSSDNLTCLLALPEAGPVELTLYDISGRLVLERRFEATEPTEMEAVIDVSNLASGVYTLRANQGGLEASARAVVLR